MATDPLVAMARAEVTAALVRLEPLFVDGMVLTFIAAHPTNPDAHLIVTAADTWQDIIDTIDETIQSGNGRSNHDEGGEDE